MTGSIKAAVIGCGKIGSLYDEMSLPAPHPRTHCRAYHENPLTVLTAVCDHNIERAKACAEYWGVEHYFSDISELLKLELDVLSVCTPETERTEIFRQLSSTGIRALICEKPWADNFGLGKELLEACTTSKTKAKVLVNFSRRWDSGLSELINKIHTGFYGAFSGGSCIYGKGLANNGSHIIDILNWALGLPQSVEAKAALEDDRADGDSTISAILDYGKQCYLNLEISDHRWYVIWEIDLRFEKGRLRISDRGFKLESWLAENDELYAGYKVLVEQPRQESNLALAMSSLINDAVCLIRGDEIGIRCSVSDALDVLRVVDAIKASYRDKRPQRIEPL